MEFKMFTWTFVEFIRLGDVTLTESNALSNLGS